MWVVKVKESHARFRKSEYFSKVPQLLNHDQSSLQITAQSQICGIDPSFHIVGLQREELFVNNFRLSLQTMSEAGTGLMWRCANIYYISETSIDTEAYIQQAHMYTRGKYMCKLDTSHIFPTADFLVGFNHDFVLQGQRDLRLRWQKVYCQSGGSRCLWVSLDV